MRLARRICQINPVNQSVDVGICDPSGIPFYLSPRRPMLWTDYLDHRAPCLSRQGAEALPHLPISSCPENSRSQVAQEQGFSEYKWSESSAKGRNGFAGTPSPEFSFYPSHHLSIVDDMNVAAESATEVIERGCHYNTCEAPAWASAVRLRSTSTEQSVLPPPHLFFRRNSKVVDRNILAEINKNYSKPAPQAVLVGLEGVR